MTPRGCNLGDGDDFVTPGASGRPPLHWDVVREGFVHPLIRLIAHPPPPASCIRYTPQHTGGTGGFSSFPVQMGGMRMGGMPGGMTMNMGGGGMGMSSGASAAPTRQPPPIEHTLNLSLEELYTGTSKRMRITKKVCLSELPPPSLRAFVGARLWRLPFTFFNHFSSCCLRYILSINHDD